MSLSLIADALQITQPLLSLIKSLYNWWNFILPAQKVLGPASKNNSKLVVFVRDFFVAPGTQLLVREGVNGATGVVPNVLELWPRVEATSLTRLFNTLGQIGKTRNIEIIEMSKDAGIWNHNLIVLGAQAQKCFDFYTSMPEVAYKMNASDISNNKTGKVVQRVTGYGYGIILKSKNPFVPKKGVAFLLGGFGTLGTEAAVYYFTRNLADLGKQFGRNSFGIVVRASASAGVESAERLKKFDIKFENR